MSKKSASRHYEEVYEEQKKKKPWLVLIIILLLLAILFFGLTAWALLFKGPELSPDYAPKAEDENAVSIEGDTEEKLEKPEGGGSVGITYVPEITIDLSEEKAEFLFQNPGRSNSDVVLQIVIQDEIVAQSDRLVPGKQLNSMPLLNDTADMLSPGGYKGKFVVLFYDPVSAERSVLKSEGAAEIIVEE